MNSCDWRVRPLTTQMRRYARLDVHYLPALYHILMRKLLILGGGSSEGLRGYRILREQFERQREREKREREEERERKEEREREGKRESNDETAAMIGMSLNEAEDVSEETDEEEERLWEGWRETIETEIMTTCDSQSGPEKDSKREQYLLSSPAPTTTASSLSSFPARLVEDGVTAHFTDSISHTSNNCNIMRSNQSDEAMWRESSSSNIIQISNNTYTEMMSFSTLTVLRLPDYSSIHQVLERSQHSCRRLWTPPPMCDESQEGQKKISQLMKTIRKKGLLKPYTQWTEHNTFVLRKLLIWRDKEAKLADESVSFLCPPDVLTDYAMELPETIDDITLIRLPLIEFFSCPVDGKGRMQRMLREIELANTLWRQEILKTKAGKNKDQKDWFLHRLYVEKLESIVTIQNVIVGSAALLVSVFLALRLRKMI